MPRNGSDVYSKPAGTTATSSTTIESAKYNATIDDLVVDANTVRSISNGGTSASTAAGALTALGAQPADPGLLSIAGLTTAADRMIYTTAADTYAVATLTAAGRAILDDADATAQRATLGLAIGTNVQAYDADLAAIAALADPNADRLLFWDDSAGAYARLTAGAGLAISGTTMTAGATVGILTTTGAATVGPWALPAGVTRFTVTSNKSSLSGTGNIIVQLRVAAAFVTSGYDSRSLAGSSGNVTSTAGMIASIGAGANFFDGAMEFWLHNPATNLWLCRHTGSSDTAGAQMIAGSGSIALAGAIDGLQINSTAGTFDVSSFNVHY